MERNIEFNVPVLDPAKVSDVKWNTSEFIVLLR